MPQPTLPTSNPFATLGTNPIQFGVQQTTQPILFPPVAQPTNVQSQQHMLEYLKQSCETQQAILKEIQSISQHLANSSTSTETSKHVTIPVSQTQHIHKEIWCDNCGRSNWQGVRYKCLNCQDYDLCDVCEAQPNVHEATHMFIKIKDTDLFNKQVHLYIQQQQQQVIHNTKT